MTISSSPFGSGADGQAATLWTIENADGLSVGVTDWGATLVTVRQPDRDGRLADVVLGFDDASVYRPSKGYLGATCGRYANRIAGGRFRLAGRDYELAQNDGPNHLHGGDRGFDSRLWTARPYSEGDRTGVVFSYLSPDGEENYPGNLSVQADYALDESGRFTMDFHAETDRETVVNITNHAYWNLAGRDSGSVLNQVLVLNASSYLAVDDTAIPDGPPRTVDGGPFDFRRPKAIGADIDRVRGGYDHCMIVDGPAGTLRLAAEARDPFSGRTIRLSTDRPGVQFYSGNFLDGTPYPTHAGFCLEPQDFPDAPNRPDFPSTVLSPGDSYHHRSMVEFSVSGVD